jgi:FkbM family methyltransferase
MNENLNTLLQIVNHILYQHSSLASQIEGIAASIQGKGFGTATIFQENNAVQKLSSVVPKLAIDIGGNVGEYSAELRNRYADLEIHIFEPASVNIKKLNQRFHQDKNIKIIPVAVSDKKDFITLFSDTPGSGLASLTKRNLAHINIELNLQESIESICFEDYWKNILERRVLDIVKMDIEGHELNALRGFGVAIRFTKIIQFEFGGANIDTRTFFRDFWYFFKEHNFQLYRITPTGFEHIPFYRETDEFFSTTNYVAINNNKLS